MVGRPAAQTTLPGKTRYVAWHLGTLVYVICLQYQWHVSCHLREAIEFVIVDGRVCKEGFEHQPSRRFAVASAAVLHAGNLKNRTVHQEKS